MSGFIVADIDSDPFQRDRDKLVTVAYTKIGVASTTWYMFVDLDGGSYPHTSGSTLVLAQVLGKAVKSSSGSKWAAQIGIVTRIDGTDADIAILPGVSVALRDTSTLSSPEQVVDFFPHLLRLEVSGGAIMNTASNAFLFNEPLVNTGLTLEDVFGVGVNPAVGDMLIRADQISGGGSLDFAFGMQYFVE